MANIIPGPAYRIHTDRLVIRCWNPDDAPKLKSAIDQRLDHLLPWMPWAYNEPEDIQKKIDRLRYFRGRFDLGQDFVYGIFSKDEKELSASSLQSPDDLEATYREKSKKSYKGYVANLTETCDPDNPLQLITKVQVASNHTEDAELLVETLPDLKERTDLDTLYTDDGYGSLDADQTLQDNQVEQIQTAIRGRIPSTEKLNLADFEIKQAESGKPTQIACPGQQSVAVQQSSQKKGFVAHFEAEVCQTCPFLQKCPAQRGKRDLRFHLRFNQQQVNMSQRRQRSLAHQEEGRNLRAAVEATVRQVKHPFPVSKLPVRGRFRITCMVIGSALVSNARRIQRYLVAKTKLENEQ